MGLAVSDEFKAYQRQGVANARVVAAGLEKLGYRVVTGGTDTHIVLVDTSSKKLSGAKAEKVLEDVSISVNKNTGAYLMCSDFEQRVRITVIGFVTVFWK